MLVIQVSDAIKFTLNCIKIEYKLARLTVITPRGLSRYFGFFSEQECIDKNVKIVYGFMYILL